VSFLKQANYGLNVYCPKFSLLTPPPYFRHPREGGDPRVLLFVVRLLISRLRSRLTIQLTHIQYLDNHVGPRLRGDDEVLEHCRTLVNLLYLYGDYQNFGMIGDEIYSGRQRNHHQ